MPFNFWPWPKKIYKNSSLEVEEILFDQHQLTYRDLKWADRLEQPLAARNINLLKYFLVLIMVVAGLRSAYLVVVGGGAYADKARSNYVKEIWAKAPRGMIYDFKNKPLVKNISTFNLIAVPGELPRDSGSQEKIINDLASLLNKDPLDIAGQFSSVDRFSFRPVLILEDLTHEEILSLKSKLSDLPGLQLEENFKRDYGGSIFSHIIGYTGRASPTDLNSSNYLATDIIGKTGLEYEYEDFLRGSHGVTSIETKAQGSQGEVIGQTNSRSGDNLVLFIDYDLQKKLTEAMGQTLANLNLTSGAAVAIDPRSGGILAMQSFPNFNANVFSNRLSSAEYDKLFNNTDRPLFNRAIAGLYPPGSTIKPFIGVGALQEKIVDDKTIINDTGSIFAGTQEFKGWKALGIVDIYKAISMSSNIFFYTVGGGYGNISGLGPLKIAEYLKRFGFDSLTNIDLPSEAKGFIPSPDWKLVTKHEGWFIGDTYNMSIGQGFVQVTPLELAEATTAIANRGALLKPRIVKSITDSQGRVVKNTEPEIISKDFVDPNSLNIIRNAMHDTVTDGSGRALSQLPGSAGAKTGTAQTGVGTNTHAWFTVFAPFDNPRIALTVMIENGGEGSSVAVPIARDVLEWYLSSYPRTE